MGPVAYSPYPYPPPPPPPPKRETPGWVWLLVTLGVIAAVLLFFGGCVAVLSSDTSTDSAASSPTPSTTAESVRDDAATSTAPPTAARPSVSGPTTGQMNTPIADGTYATFSVSSVETGIPSVGDYLTDNAQGAFTIVTVSVTNTSTKPIRFTASQQHVRDANNRVFEVDSSATFTANDDASWINEINPGNSVTVRLVYDMPPNASPATISLRASGGRPIMVALR